MIRYIFILLVFTLTACESPQIVEKITQSQAIEIVALLNSYGISANITKERGGKGAYSVHVRRGHYHQSLSLLHSHRLPSEREMTFKDLIEQRGFLPNSRKIDGLRFDHALAIELEELLENNSAISSAKVVVRSVNANQDLGPGVSIVVQKVADTELEQEQVHSLVRTVVPGITKEQIVLAISDVSTSDTSSFSVQGVANDAGVVVQVPLVSFLSWRLPEGDITEITTVLGALIVTALIVGLVFGYLISYYRRMKVQLRQAPETNIVALDIDQDSRLPQVDS